MMFDANAAFHVNCALALGTVVMAAFAPQRERRAAMLCASFLLASWLVGCVSYLPDGPVAWLKTIYTETGYASSSHLPGGEAVDLWSLTDLTGMVMILAVSRQYWWGKLLYLLMLAGCVCHAIYWLRWTDWGAYQGALDYVSLAEDGLFFIIGGRGLFDAIGRALSRGSGFGLLPVRRVLGTAKAVGRV
jgi:hypothetical protein